MKSIIVSGNPNYGFGAALKEEFPNAEFYSRSSNDFDFKKHENHVEFAKRSLNFDVYISCSCLSRFRQVLLLEEVYRLWSESRHRGQIIVLGSSADTPVKGTPWLYPVEKKAIRAYCRNLSVESAGGVKFKASGIRVSYLSPGHIDTPRANEKHPKADKLSGSYLAQVVRWLIEQPENVNISELCLDPIQQTL